ncbi:MAG: 4-(cytidine 5'-diphospho)-2-C-methyl-D-erythritol kinase [Bacteroidetes bacterium]|nr:4-(cytidine 5'-diphospho)-2-C-methyl-D-erythritol kinase [Bacteroidota bacterium]
MIVKPNCKINLGLNVVRKRMDDYHDIETVFYPVGLCDSIEINTSADNRLRFSSTGLRIPGDAASNLCIQAFELIQEHFKIPAVDIRLQKNIPMGSGLGGGSADGAFTLKALNEMFRLGLSKEQLKAFASRLGSDCTFFIENEPAFAKGRGELLEKTVANLSGFYILLAIPQLHMNTAEAYSMMQPGRPATSLKEIISLPVIQWKGKLINDFESHVCQRFPLIGKIKELLYEKGAVYSAMSGSGSAVYGLFNEIPAVEGLFPGCFVWVSPSI